MKKAYIAIGVISIIVAIVGIVLTETNRKKNRECSCDDPKRLAEVSSEELDEILG